MKKLFSSIVSFGSLFASQHSGAFTDGEKATAERYFRGQVETTPFERPFRASKKDDVVSVDSLTEQERRELIRIALRSLEANEGVISILAAGASSRMNPALAPADVKQLLNDKEIKSKALVPIGKVDGRLFSFFGAFMANIANFQSQASKALQKDIRLKLLILSNDDYRQELEEDLVEHRLYGFSKDQLLIFHQELGNQMIATPDDARKYLAKPGIPEIDAAASMKLSEKAAQKFNVLGDAKVLMLENEKVPLGHGEFFHQLVSSGTFLKLFDDKIKWVSVRNIDNSAAAFDEEWLVTLGLFLSRGLDMQPEVSPRSSGQKGGSLIVSDGNHILAEDPQIAVSTAMNQDSSKVSYWFNDAVAIFNLDYVVDIYKNSTQSKEEFIQEVRAANKEALEDIASRGRKKFPLLMDAKPARNNAPAIAMKVETNMWQSTSIVSQDIKIRAVGVKGVKNIQEEFRRATHPEERLKLIKSLRLLATKQWDGPEESYESNKPYIEEILNYIVKSNLFSPDIGKD